MEMYQCSVLHLHRVSSFWRFWNIPVKINIWIFKKKNLDIHTIALRTKPTFQQKLDKKYVMAQNLTRQNLIPYLSHSSAIDTKVLWK